jgi:hypothetical protein
MNEHHVIVGPLLRWVLTELKQTGVVSQILDDSDSRKCRSDRVLIIVVVVVGAVKVIVFMVKDKHGIQSGRCVNSISVLKYWSIAHSQEEFFDVCRQQFSFVSDMKIVNVF